MKERAKESAQRVLAWPPVAHHWAAYQRANGLRFMRSAAAIALFGYLSLFPLVVLAFVVLGVALSRYPELRADVNGALQDALPLLFSDNADQNPVDVQSVAEATVTAGFVSVVALLLAGLGWINAAIEGTRRMLGALPRPRNFLMLKLEDLGALLVVGSLILIALVASVGVRSAGLWFLDVLGIELSSSWFLQLSADLVAAVLIALVITAFYWFSWNRPNRRWRSVLTAAMLSVICLGLLSRFAYLVVGRTLTNPVYGALGSRGRVVAVPVLRRRHPSVLCLLVGGGGGRERAQ